METAFGIMPRMVLVDRVRKALDKLDPAQELWDFRDWKWSRERASDLGKV